MYFYMIIFYFCRFGHQRKGEKNSNLYALNLEAKFNLARTLASKSSKQLYKKCLFLLKEKIKDEIKKKNQRTNWAKIHTQSTRSFFYFYSLKGEKKIIIIINCNIKLHFPNKSFFIFITLIQPACLK